MKHLQHKITDYNRFGQVLLALSTIFMLGLLIPNGGKTLLQLITMLVSIVVFLSGAMVFFFQAKKVREKLNDLQENQLQ